MDEIKAIVQGDLKGDRLLRLSVRSEGLPVLVYAEDGYPHFRSTGDLEDGQEIKIVIRNKHVWEVEAGENILAGEGVYAGDEGKLFSRKSGEDSPADLIGYAIHNAEEGELIRFVRSFQINGNWAKKVNEVIEESE